MRGLTGLQRLREAIFNWRNRLLANPRFQRIAPSLPVGGAMTRLRTRQLFDICAGFVYSQILAACVELELLERLKGGARSVADLANACRLPPAAMDRLCRAAAALDLLERRPDGRFGLGQQGAALVGNPSVYSMIRHHAVLYRDLSDPVALLRRPRGDTEMARYWGYAAPSAAGGTADAAAGLSSNEISAYTQLMADTQAFIAAEVVASYPFRRRRHVMDVGGGAGAFATALLKAAPDLRVTVFDLPAVAEEAGRRLASVEGGSRATAVGGDFLSGELPSGADMISLVRILHDHDDAQAAAILRACHAALPPGGEALIAEPMAETKGARAMGEAYFGFYLWAMGSGRPRTKRELVDMLRRAGFSRVRELDARQPLLVRMLTAEK